MSDKPARNNKRHHDRLTHEQAIDLHLFLTARKEEHNANPIKWVELAQIAKDELGINADPSAISKLAKKAGLLPAAVIKQKEKAKPTSAEILKARIERLEDFISARAPEAWVSHIGLNPID